VGASGPVLIDSRVLAAASRLDGEAARQVWAFIGRFTENSAHPSLSLERLHRGGGNLWSARVTHAVRAILHRDCDTWTLVYVGRHDQAYRWVEDQRVERHPRTGALQVVRSAETWEPPARLGSPTASATEPDLPRLALFEAHADDYLLDLGLPEDWLPRVRAVFSDDELLDLIPVLPEEVTERLFALATGQTPAPPPPVAASEPILASHDARRRFHALPSEDDLARLLEQPLAIWIAFLHESQHRLAYGSFAGPLKVTGGAGTGKTTVALHRARHLARAGKRVLLTTFVTTLCTNLERSLRLFCTPEELSRITVATVHSRALAIVAMGGHRVRPATSEDVRRILERVAPDGAGPLNCAGLAAEWEQVVQAGGIVTWEEYRTTSRAGRGRALGATERAAVWEALQRLYGALGAAGQAPFPEICRLATASLREGRVQSPFDAVVVDEVQDIAPAELQFLAALAGEGPDSLTLTGDVGQRIYGRRFSLRTLGIDVRGRSHILRLNYRTTEEIRRFADRMRVADGDDMDGGMEDRHGTISLVNGPHPELRGFDSREAQLEWVVEAIRSRLTAGLSADEVGIFTRHNSGLDAVESALRSAGIPCYRIERSRPPEEPAVHVGTVHRAKGLEFKVVFTVNASADEFPSAHALSDASDTPARQEIAERERQLLYVSVTRARDEALVTWVGRPSPFLPSGPATDSTSPA
jgi:superfamily I DNA/RNA helicase